MPKLPKARSGRPPVTQYNKRIIELMEKGWGIDRIWKQLKREGADIGRSTLHERMKAIREADEAGLPLPEGEDLLVLSVAL